MIALLILLLLILLDYFIGMRPARLVAASESPAPIVPENPVKASVVVLAMGLEESPAEYINMMLRQDYPDFELILVCDSNAETASMYAEAFADKPNVHITFLPPGSRRLSRRKLALTIGIKRASGDVVVTTSTGVRPLSSSWLTAILAPFNSEDSSAAAASMGVIALNPEDFGGAHGKTLIFNHQYDTLQWLGAALDNKPTRCDGFNLAFRRELFFELKGYASSLLYVDGDDDIFLQDLHAFGQCVPIVNDSSLMVTDWEEDSERILIEYREQYLFTRRFLPKASYLRSAFSSWCRWLAIPAALIPILNGIEILLSIFCGGAPALRQAIDSAEDICGGIFFSLPANTMPEIAEAILLICLSLILLTAYFLITIKVFSKASMRISPSGRISGAAMIPLRLLFRPIRNFIFRERHRSAFSNHFTYTHS